MNMKEEIKRLESYREAARQGGGPEEIEKQRKAGKLTARERIDRLLAPGTFIETGMFLGHDFSPKEEEKTFGDGIIAGWGEIDGRKVCVMAHDRTIHRGSVGRVGRSKYCELVEIATQSGVPFIGLIDAPGARIEVPRLGVPDHGFLRFSFFKRHVLASGVIPQISAILGTCAGNAVFAPALTDFIIMVEGIANMVYTGPRVIRVIKEVTHKEATIEELGGAEVHSRLSGVADFRVRSEDECFQLIRKLLSFLPQNCREKPPRIKTEDDPNRNVDGLEELVPTESSESYDMHKVIEIIVDEGNFLEVKSEFAKNVIVGFARLNGRSVGIVASQPSFLAGALDIDSSDKESRFISFCDAFNIPLIFLIDNTGYLPGVKQEHGGIIRHGAKALYTIAEATVPKLSVILGKATGGGMSGSGGEKDLGIDRVFAWPIAQRQIMSPEGAVEVLFKREIAQAENPEEFRQQKIEELRSLLSGPYYSAATEEIDEVIKPGETRQRLIAALELLANKAEPRHYKKHGVMPV